MPRLSCRSMTSSSSRGERVIGSTCQHAPASVSPASMPARSWPAAGAASRSKPTHRCPVDARYRPAEPVAQGAAVFLLAGHGSGRRRSGHWSSARRTVDQRRRPHRGPDHPPHGRGGDGPRVHDLDPGAVPGAVRLDLQEFQRAMVTVLEVGHVRLLDQAEAAVPGQLGKVLTVTRSASLAAARQRAQGQLRRRGPAAGDHPGRALFHRLPDDGRGAHPDLPAGVPLGRCVARVG